MAGNYFVLFVTFIWYAITFLIYFDISFDFEMKRKNTKKLYYFKKKKRKKKFYLRPPEIETGPTDSESDMLTTLPSMHMELIRDQAQNTCDCGFHINRDKEKNNSAPFRGE